MNCIYHFQKTNIILIGSEDSQIRALNFKTGKTIQEIDGQSFEIKSILYLNDGRTFISGGGNKCIHIWGIDQNSSNNNDDNTWDDLSTSYGGGGNNAN